ncbi:MAG: hypothetical protein Q7T26_07720 [Dehalococcoidia bacterium]|nr:hypothetical protein [Dehalococcoidia bacterium]
MSPAARFSSRTVDVEPTPDGAFAEAYRLGWTDGLPIIPPTEDRVAAMVDASGLPADKLMGKVPPAYGAATIEKIAVNAVMAGCLAEYMPVVVAATEAMCEKQFNLDGIQSTTNPVGVALIINGPIRKQLDVNCERNCLGPGWRANATIGRAARLVMLNIGGGTPGTGDKAIHGFPGKYSFCFGELEESNPWEPLHVERGFKREDSTVTVVGAQGTSNNNLANEFTIEAMLDVVANSMSYLGSNNVMIGEGEPLIILTAAHGELAKKAGMSKMDVKRYLWEKSGTPLSAVPKKGTADRLWPRLIVVDGIVKPCKRPEDVMLVIAGGPEMYHAVFVATFGDTHAVTKLVQAPKK